jgi:iron only hydrogenase large subunit-like protein/ferredoxin
MAEHQVSFILDGREVQAPPGTTVLEAARKLGHAIPTLCHHPLIESNGRCGVCTVEREPAVMIRACSTPVEQGAVYHTTSPAVTAHRRETVKLLLSRHELSCHVCDRHGECELERLVGRLGITDGSPVGLAAETFNDRSSASISLLGDRCLACGRCVALCDALGWGALRMDEELLQARAVDEPGLAGPHCTSCGQCTLACPSGALVPRSAVVPVESALMDRDRYCVAVLEPTAAAALMNELKVDALPRLIGTLASLGFAGVVDSAWGADAYLAGLADRLHRERPRAAIVSPCEAVRRHVRLNRPELAEWLPPEPGPSQTTAFNWRQKVSPELGLAPGHCYLVEVTTGTAAKEGVRRHWVDRERGLDASVTVRELAGLLRRLGVNPEKAKARGFTHLRGSRLGTMLGAPGAVTDGLAVVWAQRSGSALPAPGGGFLPPAEEEREIEIPGGGPARVLVAHGGRPVQRALDRAVELCAGKGPRILLELYACPGGCLGGGGLHRLAGPAELQRRYQALAYLASGAQFDYPHQNKQLRRFHPELFEPIG